MSLLGSIGGALKGAVGGFLGSGGSILGASQGAISGAQNQAKGRGKKGLQYMQQYGVAPPAIAARSLVGLPSSNVYSASPVVAGGGFGGSGASASYGRPAPSMFTTSGQVVRLKANGMPRKRYRSMNVMNVRAARRAIRRIKGARKLLQQIERQLPKQRVHSRPTHARVAR